ncbi:MAG: Crp/Fnr family transcriptional regulator [Anaerolineae bacterium]|nr:Crp/Fnr family transcriptional regulator [Anaerolineae bacterium]
MDRRDILQALPFFAGLSERDWEKVIDLFSERQYKKDDYIFLEGEAPEALYVIRTGKVKVLRHSTDGKDVVLRVCGPGNLLGTVAVFDGGGYPGTAQVIEDCSVLAISRNDCLTLVNRYPVFALAVIADLGTRLRSSAEQIRSLAVERVEQRIARVLLKLAESAGSDSAEGRVIEMPLTRQDVADMTGTTVETAIRVMSKFRRQELIKTRRGRVVLVDIPALQEIAELR